MTPPYEFSEEVADPPHKSTELPRVTVAGELMNAAAADEPGMDIVSVGPPLFASVVARSRSVTELALVLVCVPNLHDVPFERL